MKLQSCLKVLSVLIWVQKMTNKPEKEKATFLQVHPKEKPPNQEVPQMIVDLTRAPEDHF